MNTKNFWLDLPKPFFILAPMEDVTDTVFRQMILKTARPDVFFSEFVNVEGMFSIGAGIVNQRLKFTKAEFPLVAQVWGINPENFYKAAKKIVKLGFSGIDINMGCPQKKVIKKGACAGLIKNAKLAKEIIQAVKEGVCSVVGPVARDSQNSFQITRDTSLNSQSNQSRSFKETHFEKPSLAPPTTTIGKDIIFPISIKTRIGFDKIITHDWIGFLLEQGLDALTVHGRTAKEQSLVPAHWNEIGKAVQLRDQMKVKTLIVGNGDVKNRAEGLDKVKQYGVDGIMIGRGIFQNMWAFSQKCHSDPPSGGEESLANASSNKLRDPSSTNWWTQDDKKVRLDLLKSHLKLFQNAWGNTKPFSLMKKYIKIYISGFGGASELRQKLMEAKDYQDALKIITELSKTVS